MATWYAETCGVPPAMPAAMSERAIASVWPGRPYIRSRLTLSKLSSAASTPRRASAAEWMRPSAVSIPSSKLCTPSEMRFTPASRKPRKRPASTVPGFASKVISAMGSTGMRARMAESSGSMASGEKRLGVPPPMKTLTMRRPHTEGSNVSRSAISFATYSASGSAPPRSCELKSQYGHLRTHHGICTYSASGGRAVSSTRPGRSTTICGMQELQQLAQRERAVADAVLLGGHQLGGGLAHRGKEKQRVVAEAVRPARRTRDLAPPDPFGDERPRILGTPHKHHHATIIGGTLGGEA